jgi:hypothetical protein
MEEEANIMNCFAFLIESNKESTERASERERDRWLSGGYTSQNRNIGAWPHFARRINVDEKISKCLVSGGGDKNCKIIHVP